jgi:hypothetical protein
MALIVEDGTGVTNASSYISIADANTYFAQLDNASWAALTDTQKEAALRKAAQHLWLVYWQRWKGTRTLVTQGLDWPRKDVAMSVGGVDYILDDNTVPQAIIEAQLELAAQTLVSELLVTDPGGRRVKRQKVDVLEIEYEEGAGSVIARFPAVEYRVEPYLSTSTSRRVGEVVRA